MNEFLQDIMHMSASVFLIPTMVILVMFMIISILSIGGMFMEYLRERRRNKFNLEKFLKQLNEVSIEEYKEIINNSNLFLTQKKALMTLLDYADLSQISVEGIAQKLLLQEQDNYNKTVSKTDVVSKLAPMFGLMGTLIPLGPGLLALGEGDTLELSKSLLIAFDTTIVGLISASICWFISRVRKKWYKSDLEDVQAIMECILEEVEKDEKA